MNASAAGLRSQQFFGQAHSIGFAGVGVIELFGPRIAEISEAERARGSTSDLIESSASGECIVGRPAEGFATWLI
jgi:hypothetical protein